MIMGDEKNIAQVIASRIKPQGSAERNAKAFEERAAEPKSSLSEGERAASEEMIAAIHARDAEAFAEALQDFLSISEGSSEDSPSEDEEEEAPRSSFTE